MTKEFYPAIRCYIPKNFEVSSIKGYNQRWHEKYVWFIHSILFDSLTSKSSFNGFVNLQSALLQKFLGSHYTSEIITQLEQSNIIEINNHYSTNGGFSKSYRLTKKYRSKGIKGIEITKQTYCRKIEKYRQNYLSDILKESENLRHEFQALTYLRIDIESAMNYIVTNFQEDTQQFKTYLISLEQFHAMHKVSFADGRYTNIGFTFKENKGRIYSPLTSLPRKLEQFVYFQNYEGEAVLSADAPNSQLCFFNKFVKEKANKMHNIGEVLDRDGCLDIKDVSNAIEGAPLTHKPSLEPTPYVMQNWEDIIFSGKGYERMMYLYKWKGKEANHTQEERTEFKEEFFGNLFYNRYQPELTKMEQVFMAHHESEAKALRSMKYKLGNKGLAVEVQKLEAYFFHTIIVNYMRTNYKTVPFGIKHDSIMLPMSEGSYIIPELNDLFKAFFNRKEIEFKVK
jgi:hypothetical protein